MAKARVLDRHAHETEEVETARAEVGEDSLFKSAFRAPQMFQVLVCEGVRVCCWAVLQQLPGLLHALKDTSVFSMNRERVLLGKHVTTGGEESLDPRLYINLQTC